jgi:mono/diheme cytochrome c family protein
MEGGAPMLFRSMLLGLGLSVLVILPVSAAGEAPETVTLTLPEGDSNAGRAAFLALSCTTCHRVAGEEGFPEPVSATPGPTLGRYHAQRTPAQLAISIFQPSHEISAFLREPREDDLSPMGDFTEAMTVRQFVDIIAYIRSLPARAKRQESSRPARPAGK